MKKLYQSLALVVALGLGLGLASCSGKEKDAPQPQVVQPTESAKITAEEAQTNTASIGVLRAAEQAKLRIKQVSSLPAGKGYNVLLSDDRLVTLYIAGQARSLRQATQPTSVDNPIKSVDLGTKGVVVFHLADGSRISLLRADENAQGALAANQSVAPESKFLFSLLGGDLSSMDKLHSKAKSMTIVNDQREEYQVAFDELGNIKTSTMKSIENEDSGGYRSTATTVYTWEGERLIKVGYTRRYTEGESSGETSTALQFGYNQLNQAEIKSLIQNNKPVNITLSYYPAERRLSYVTDDEQSTLFYDEFYRLVRQEVIWKKEDGQWDEADVSTYTYNKNGDILSIETETTIERFTYEYDAKGNWTKRTEVRTYKDSTMSSERTSVVTRKIVY
ncbi:MAG: hypothetical protein SOW66_05045 [Porphyromonas sp.]|nr:hypothetical protein [Porphyromonas sp.]